MLNYLKNVFQEIKGRFKEDSCINLIWLINILPKIAGSPLLSKKNYVLFWIIHITLLCYVYIVGTLVYQIYYAEGVNDSVNSFFNVSIFILVLTSSCWLIFKRSDLNDLLVLVQKNDDLVKESGRQTEKQQKLLKNVKFFIISCNIFHFINDILVFIPLRTLDMDKFSVSSCVGLEPLNKTPNKEICIALLTIQQLTNSVVVGSYDVILLFLIAHTTAIFQILYEDMMSLSGITEKCNDSIEMSIMAADRLKNIIIRHSSVLHTVNQLQDTYSVAIGIGFGLYAISVCLFFVLPLDVCLNFVPLVYYYLFVFFLYCFEGQRLTTASERFEMAVYSCGWERLGIKEQKLVLLMLKQAQKPVILQAAGVVPIRIYSFAYTMQSIYKFAALFKL